MGWQGAPFVVGLPPGPLRRPSGRTVAGAGAPDSQEHRGAGDDSGGAGADRAGNVPRVARANISLFNEMVGREYRPAAPRIGKHAVIPHLGAGIFSGGSGIFPGMGEPLERTGRLLTRDRYEEFMDNGVRFSCGPCA
jgi:hypothetical protein